MLADFDVSPVTVQRALDELIRDGFAVARGPHGTFVADSPPHLRNVALVLSISFPRSLYFDALAEAARHVAAAVSKSTSSDREIHFREYRFSTLVDHREGWERLCADASAHRFGAVIYGMPPFELADVRTLLEPGLPQVVIQARSSDNLPAISIDTDSFITRATQWLVARGRKRIAHLRMDAHTSPQQFIDQVSGRVPEIRPYWVQSIGGWESYRGAASVVNLLMQLHGDRRPDAIIVHDDNLVEPTIAGLLAAAVRVPEDVEVVAHTNFPLPVPSPLPIRRLGFDLREALRRSLDVIDDVRAGRTSAPCTAIAARFEDELQEASFH